MATKAELETALRNAHSKGEKEHAKQLANAIKSGDYSDAPAPAEYGFGREMLSGLTFGYGDELEAALTDTPIDAIRAAQSQYREENPMTAMGAATLGALPTMLIPGAGAANAMRGIGVGAKVARGVATVGSGSAAGAITGSGESVEGERMAGAQEGGLFGAITAPLGAGAGRVLGAVGNRGGRYMGKANDLPDDHKAMATVLGAMEAGNVSPRALLGQIPKGQTIAEQSPVLSDYAGAASRLSPEIKATASDIVDTRSANRGPELSNRVYNEIIPEGRLTFGQIEDAVAAHKSTALPLYQRAFDSGVTIDSPQINRLMEDKDFQKAYRIGQEILRKEMSAEGIDPGPLLKFDPDKAMSLREADFVKRGLDDLIYMKSARGATGKGMQKGVKDQRISFMREVDAQAPDEYINARAIYAGAFEAQEAAELGADAWKKGPEYVSRYLGRRGLSDSEKQAFRYGAAAKMDEMLSGTSDGREVFRAQFNSDKARKTVEALSQVEGPSAVNPLVRRQRSEADFGNELLRGSQTAGRSAADANLQGADIPLPRRMGASELAYEALQRIQDKARVGSTKARDVGNILLNTDDVANDAALRQMDAISEILRSKAGQRGALSVGGSGVAGGAGIRYE